MNTYSVKDVSKLPEPPLMKWAIYFPRKSYSNFVMYRVKGHAKNALRMNWRAAENAQLFEWVDDNWVERDISEVQ